MNGAVASVADEANPVEVVPKSRDRKEVFFIKFKALKCGFSKEVKLKRREKRPSYAFFRLLHHMGFIVRIQFLQKDSFERNSNDYRSLSFNFSHVLHGFYKKVNHPISSAHYKENVMNDQAHQDAQYPIER